MTAPTTPGGWADEIREVIDGKRQWTVVHGDNREILPEIESVDVTLTDPPFSSATHKGARSSHNDYELSPIDFDPITDLWFVPALLKITRRWVIAFCELEMLADYRRAAGGPCNDGGCYVRGGIWTKPDAMPQLTGDRPGQPGEGVAIMHRAGKKRWNGGGHPARWDVPIERNDRCHPTQKPIDLMIQQVRQFSDPGDLILDPFCGSGATGVAALKCGRRFIGLEINPEYATAAERRCLEASPDSLLSARNAKQIGLFQTSK